MKPIKILLVEDEESYFKIVKSALKSVPDSFLLHWANTFHNATKELISNEYDVLLLDFKLGEGYTAKDILDFLIEKEIDSPVVLFSSYTEQECQELSDGYNFDSVYFVEKMEFAKSPNFLVNILKTAAKENKQYKQIKSELSLITESINLLSETVNQENLNQMRENVNKLVKIVEVGNGVPSLIKQTKENQEKINTVEQKLDTFTKEIRSEMITLKNHVIAQVEIISSKVEMSWKMKTVLIGLLGGIFLSLIGIYLTNKAQAESIQEKDRVIMQYIQKEK